MKLISKIAILLTLCHCSYASTSSSWFVSVQAGGESISNKLSYTTVHNGSGYPTPYDQDIYSLNNPEMSALLAGLQAGRRWVFSNPYISAFSLGVAYQHFFSVDVNGQITQFSLPEFKNYNYRWNLASNLFLTNAKLNGPSDYKLSPYINGGIGVVYNNPRYYETALGGVTPRVSPGFRSGGSQFAYILGAGFDYYLGQQFILSVGYQYTSLGRFSGYGLDDWSSEQLDLGAHHSNAFLLGLAYVFDGQKRIGTQ
jgi:opacity protein-like surface antigen